MAFGYSPAERVAMDEEGRKRIARNKFWKTLALGVIFGGTAVAIGAGVKGCKDWIYNHQAASDQAPFDQRWNEFGLVGVMEMPYHGDMMPTIKYLRGAREDGTVESIGDSSLASWYSLDFKGMKGDNSYLMTPEIQAQANRVNAEGKKLSQMLLEEKIRQYNARSNASK